MTYSVEEKVKEQLRFSSLLVKLNKLKMFLASYKEIWGTGIMDWKE